MALGLAGSFIVLELVNPEVIPIAFSQFWVLRDTAIELSLMLGIMLLVVRAQANGNFRRQIMSQAGGASASRNVNVAITPQFFIWSDQDLAIKIAWRRVVAIARDTGHIYVFTHEASALIVPRRAFPDAMTAHRFFETAHGYWREAKGTPPPIPHPDGNTLAR